MAESSPIELQGEITRLQRSLQLFSACNRALIHAKTETSLLQEICQLMIDLGSYRLAWVGYIRHDAAQTVEPVVHAGKDSDYLESLHITWADTTWGKGPTGRAIRSGQPCLVQDMNVEADYTPWKQSAQQHGYKSSIALPLTDQNGVFGTLNLYATMINRFHPEEVQLLSQLAADLSYGVTTLRASQIRQQTEAALQQSYEQYDNLVKRIPIGVYKFRMQADGETQFVYVSPRWAEMNQLDPAAVLADASLAFRLVHPDDMDAFIQLNEQARRTLNQFVWEGRVVIGEEVRWRHIESLPTRQSNGDIIWDGIQYDITDRKLAAMEIAMSEQRYASLAAAAPVGIFRADAMGDCTYVNDRWMQIAGRSFDAPLGRGWVNGLHPEDRELVAISWYHAVQENIPFQIECRFQSPDGQLSWVFVQAVAEYDGDGAVTGYVGTITDITARKQAEMSLEESEERLRLALTATNQGLYDLNIQTGVAIVNPEYATMLGYDPATFRETNAQWIERLHPDDQALVAETYRAYVQGDIPNYAVEFRQQTRSGDWKWILSLGKIVAWDAAGNPLRMLGTHTDISERKAAEAERLQAEQLRRELKLLEDILDVVMAGYWDWDILNHQHYMSFGWKRMLGYEDDELPTKPETWQELIFPEDLPLVMGHFEQHVQSRGQISYYNEVRYRHKNGSTVWLICSGQVIEWDAAGNPLRMIGCHIDITDRKQTEAKLQQLNQELQQSNQDLEQFAYITSHDLQEPLRAIIGYSQLLMKNYSEVLADPIAQESLFFIIEGGQRMSQLIRDLLAYSRIGSQTLNLVTTDCNVILAEVLQNLKSTIDETQAVITSDRLPTLPVDQTQFRQLLQNLISNALKFWCKTPPQIHIQVVPQLASNSAYAPTDSATHYQFSIQDNGIGIKPQYLTHIFEIFRRLHSRSRFPGTGIGLAISKKVVERHGGQIWATSELGQGTTFFFTLSANPHDNIQE